MSPLLAPGGPAATKPACPLFEGERTHFGRGPGSQFDPISNISAEIFIRRTTWHKLRLGGVPDAAVLITRAHGHTGKACRPIAIGDLQGGEAAT